VELIEEDKEYINIFKTDWYQEIQK
jgi:hypothetical protein